MKRTFADIVLERCEKVTPGPWWLVEEQTHKSMFVAHGSKTDLSDQFDILESYNKQDYEFIAHSRTDVPELCRRLKKACEMLRIANTYLFPINKGEFHDIADDLEAPLEEK